MLDREVSTSREHSRFGDLADVVIHQGDVRGFKGRLGSSNTHRDPDVGLRKRRGIINPITDHGDNASLVLHRLDDTELVFWQQIGPHFVDPGFRRDRLRRCLIVSSQHDHPFHATGLQARYRSLCVRSDAISKNNHTKRAAIGRYVDRGSHLMANIAWRRGTFLPHECRIARQNSSARNCSHNAATGNHFKVLRFADRKPALR